MAKSKTKWPVIAGVAFIADLHRRHGVFHARQRAVSLRGLRDLQRQDRLRKRRRGHAASRPSASRTDLACTDLGSGMTESACSARTDAPRK